MTSEDNPKKASQKHPMELTCLDVEELSNYVTNAGKLVPGRYRKLSAKQQRHVSRTIKRARNLLLMK